MKDTHYKLTYFNLGALAEPIRWAFVVAKVPFEDERIELEDWPALMKSGRFPLENLPLLEIDGTVYTQSAAILRYLGKRYGLVAGDDIQDLRVDQVAEIVTDGRLAFSTWVREQDPEIKDTIRRDLLDNLYVLVLRQLESIVSSTTGDFISGNKLTYGDLALGNWLKIWEDVFDPDLLDDFPALDRLKKAVLDIPEIRAWMETRPKTSF